jgi:pyrroline-5-carboxylate reductase
MPTRLLLVGCGRMGKALVRGWQAAGDYEIFVVNPSPVDLGVPEAREIKYLAPTFKPDIVVLAIKPQKFAEVLPECKRLGSTLFISVAAGRTIAGIERVLGAVPIVRAMPNMAATLQQSCTVAVGNIHVSAYAQQLAVTALSSVGDVLWVNDERHMNMVTALSGSGPAYVFYLVEALAQAAEGQGLPSDLAEALARQMVIGAGLLLQKRTGQTPAELRAEVTSPGGTTLAAMDVLQDGRFQSVLEEALSVGATRARALAG